MNRIKQLRDKLGVTQQEFSRLIGITQSAISKLENDIKKPSYRTACKLLKIYKDHRIKIDLSELMKDDLKD